MKTLKRSITVLVCLILFTSCTKSIDYKKEKEYIEVKKGITYYKGEPFTGEIFRNYDNGQLEYKANYKDGKEDGLYEVYLEKEGKLSYKWNFKNGKKNVYEQYYDNGQLELKANYKDGKYNGLYEYYYENGKLQFKINFKDGKQDGSSESYDKDGKRID